MVHISVSIILIFSFNLILTSIYTSPRQPYLTVTTTIYVSVIHWQIEKMFFSNIIKTKKWLILFIEN